jgi:threonyl-tRNA synthetase
MLATKAEDLEDGFRICGKPCVFEHKYDGFRMVISYDGKEIKLFTRRLEDVTKQFPDVTSVVKSHIKGESFILDSEAVGFDHKTEKYLPFESISQRIKRKHDTKDDLEKYIWTQEEAKKRDHRIIGKEMKIFTVSDLIGSGLPLMQPRGMIVRQEIENYLWQLHKNKGYFRVWTPHIAKEALYEVSGHASKFGDELFRVQGKEEKFFMKPMNCPHQTMAAHSATHHHAEKPNR